jgi:hypothetical protein
MIKRIVRVFLTALCIVFITACADDSDSDDSISTAPKPLVPDVVVYPSSVIPPGVDTDITISATNGFALTAVLPSGACHYSGNIAGNPATFTMHGAQMGAYGSCTLTLTYTKDGYNFNMPVTIKVETPV